MPSSPATTPRRPSPRYGLLPVVALPILLTLLVPTLRPPRAAAHSTLAAFVSHDLRLDAGPTNLDIALDLTFHEAASFAERRRMDRNRNGRLEDTEIRRYLRDLAPEWELGLTLELDALSSDSPSPRPIPLALLHNPEIDLREEPKVALAPHVLHLRFFARTPPALRPGCDLILVDHLWDHLPSSRAFKFSPPGAFMLQPDPANAPAASKASRAGSNSLPSRIRLRCLAAP